MHLIQLMLPLHDNNEQSFARADFDIVRHELIQKFGGVTAFQRSPAIGLWKDGDDDVSRDDVVMFEVMSDELDEEWWRNYRETLERRFRQEELIVRALSITKL
jgi:hypothetical protein